MCRIDGKRHVESQAVNGLLRWSENFRTITVAFVCYPAEIRAGLSGVTWECIEDRSDLERIRIVELPYAYEPRLHFRHASSVKLILRPLIAQSRFLCFAIGGYFGDWGSLAALLAAKDERPFAIWTDRVESKVIRHGAMHRRGLVRKLYGVFYSHLVASYERKTIRLAKLGLFHGKDTFDAYNRYLREPAAVSGDSRGPREAHLVHDLHLRPEDRISDDQLAAKVDRTRVRSTLTVGYAGRAAEMKAPLQWLEVISKIKRKGIDVKATWLGDGPLLDEMRAFIKDHSLENHVNLPGFVSNRAEIIAALRDWDALLFTHVTPESPRILLEAMVSATPIVGYESSYARDLVRGFGEACLVPVGDTASLADKLVELHTNRGALDRAMRETHAHSRDFNDVAVFKHRSDLIKKVLS